MTDSKIAFIGAGNMASSLLRGMLAKGSSAATLSACDIDAGKLRQLQQDCGINVGSMTEMASQADVLVLATKPQVLREVCQQLAPLIAGRNCLVISIAAGIPLHSLQSWLGNAVAIVRCMPNTPALVSSGATGLFANSHASPAQKALAAGILGAVGVVCWLPRESDLDAVTALSGSGPAYFFLLIEAMQDAAMEMGLSAETARQLTLQTALGAAQLASSSELPAAELRRQVTSPGGTTEQAIASFEAGGLRALVSKAMKAAQQRSIELASKFS